MSNGVGSGPVYDAVVRLTRDIGDKGRPAAIRAISARISRELVPLSHRREREAGSYETLDAWLDSEGGEEAMWREELGNWDEGSPEYTASMARLKAAWESSRAALACLGDPLRTEQDVTLDACGIVADAFGIPFDPELIRATSQSFVDQYPNWNSSQC